MFGGLCALGVMALAQQSKPNVIIIYTDDQGSLDAKCYGASDLHTPNIDSLASRGTRFSQFYAAPVSSASRAGLLSGQFVKRAGLTGNAGG
ncbi:MAG: sulfatase-like hydrolase/transferase, partial [Muribaculaceae bacterium]|nr:sulfatase-like hydrolase/transferase [Muribaculaceae bacterium]